MLKSTRILLLFVVLTAAPSLAAKSSGHRARSHTTRHHSALESMTISLLAAARPHIDEVHRWAKKTFPAGVEDDGKEMGWKPGQYITRTDPPVFGEPTYDIVRTNSLLTPYLGIVNVPVWNHTLEISHQGPDIPDDNDAGQDLTFAYQGGHWVYKGRQSDR